MNLTGTDGDVRIISAFETFWYPTLSFAFSLAAGDDMHMEVETIVDVKQETESSQILRHLR